MRDLDRNLVGGGVERRRDRRRGTVRGQFGEEGAGLDAGAAIGCQRRVVADHREPALGIEAELAKLAADRYPRVEPGLLQQRLPSAQLNGHPVERLPNTLNVSFPGVNAAVLLAAIREQVACSTGSACHAGHAAPSAVLLAMGRRGDMPSQVAKLDAAGTTPYIAVIVIGILIG